MSGAKDWSKFDFVKNAIIGSALGAFASLFIPFLTPIKGALFGAFLLVAFGVYRNLAHKSSAFTKDENFAHKPKDVAAELQKFDELRRNGILTEEEFQLQKRRLLDT